MKTKSCAPENMSLLNPGEFRFYVGRAPYLTFFTQVVALPTINLNPVISENPFTGIAMSGDHIEWEELSVNFLVDEDLNGYIEIFDWMKGHGFPSSFDEYKAAIADTSRSRFEVLSSPVSVVTNTGSRNANMEFIFEDAIPVMLSAPTLTTTESGLPVVTAKVRFAYTKFDVGPIKVS